ncbi:MAG: tyrosine-type recombinase/integrase [Bacilli bacterium]
MSTTKALQQQADKIFRHTRQGSIATRRRYAEAVSRFVKFAGEQFKMQNLKNVENKHLESYVRDMQERQISIATIKTDLSAIRYFTDQLNTRKPLEDARKFNARMEIGKRNFRNHEKLWKPVDMRMLQTAPERERDVLRLMYELGARTHEVHRIDVAAARQATKTNEITLKGKNGLVRQVPVSDRAFEILLRNLDICSPGQKLFVEENEKTHEAIARIQDYIYQNRVNPISGHGLRHMRAQIWYRELREKGLSEHEAKLQVSWWLGHSRVDVVEIYLSSK